METQAEDSEPDAHVIDLVPIGDACQRLINWYDRQIAGDLPTITDLEPAMAQIQKLPAIPGPLGEDIDLVASGGSSHSPSEVVSAIERLRLIANHSQDRPTPAAQDRLPGFDEPESGT